MRLFYDILQTAYHLGESRDPKLEMLIIEWIWRMRLFCNFFIPVSQRPRWETNILEAFPTRIPLKRDKLLGMMNLRWNRRMMLH